ncbi:MAG: 3'-5' exonuclease [Thermomicrobiales bacterium]
MDTLLFGQDQTPNLVAVERTTDDQVTLYHRAPGGETTPERRPFAPWLLAERDEPWRRLSNAPVVTTLDGPHPLRYLVTFASWRAFADAHRAARDAGEPCFRFPSATEQYLVRTGQTLFKGMVFDDLRRLQLDIETLGLDPAHPDNLVVTIALRLHGGEEGFFALETTERDLLDRATEWLVAADPDVIEGHNIYNFDLPYLQQRAVRAGTTLPWGRDGSTVWIGERQQRFKAGALSLPYTPATIPGRHIVDTYQQIQRFDIGGRLGSYALKRVMKTLFPERDRPIIPGDRIRETWQRGRLAELRAYNLADVEDVDVLSRLTLPTEFYQTQILPRSLQSTATGGPGEKINDLMVRAYLHAGHAIPRARSAVPYPGGHAELIATGAFAPVVKCDVESLYPSIMLHERIASASDTLGASLPMLAELTRRRLDAKRQARLTTGAERDVWQGLQSSFKVLINSFYGYLGYGRGLFNDFEAAGRVTVKGQEVIQAVVAELNARGATPIEVDTDGVYFVPPAEIRDEGQETAFIDAVGQVLPGQIRLAHDGSYAGMLSLKLKNYALLEADGTLVLKGSSLRSRRMERCFRDFLDTASRAFIAGRHDDAGAAYFALAERIRGRDLGTDEFSQWSMLNREALGQQPRLRRLLERLALDIPSGERLELYEREDGELALVDEYANDENAGFLLRRLRDTAERFLPLFESRSGFDAAFPLITPRTNIETARTREARQQLSLFG